MQSNGSAPQDPIVVEGPLPRDGTGRLLVPFRRGDVLRVSASFVETTATEVTSSEAILRWPWQRADPASSMGWIGAESGFPFAELDRTPYRTEPPMQELRAGQRCRVGVPPTLVHVLFIHFTGEPEDTGMLPRPSGWLTHTKDTCMRNIPDVGGSRSAGRAWAEPIVRGIDAAGSSS